MRTVEDLRAELEDVPEQQAQLDLPGLMTRGRRARLRRRAVTGTAALAVVAVAATPMVWFSLRGATEGQPPVLGKPSASAAGPNQSKPTMAKPTGEPAGQNCSVYWVCQSPEGKPIDRPVLGKVVDVGGSVGSSRVVLFATRGAVSGEGNQRTPAVYAGYVTAGATLPVAGNLLFAQDAVTRELEPLPMYRTEQGRDWAVAGQLKGSATTISAVFANGTRRTARNTTAVVAGYTHFWLGGTGAMPVKFEAKTSHGTVSCTLDKCSSVG